MTYTTFLNVTICVDDVYTIFKAIYRTLLSCIGISLYQQVNITIRCI